MNTIIAIEREYASGGHGIGELLATELGVPFYNDSILEKAIEKMEMDMDTVGHLEETATNSLLYSIAMAASIATVAPIQSSDQIIGDKLYATECEIINELSAKGDCVIVGRCACNILRENKDCLKVFIYSDEESRVARAINEYNIPKHGALAAIKRKDKTRNAFYNSRAKSKWLDMNTYDLCLNSGVLGINGCVEVIKMAINARK